MTLSAAIRALPLLPEERDDIRKLGMEPGYDDPKAPQPVEWWAAANAAAVTVMAMDFATGQSYVVALPASGVPQRLFPQGAAIRRPILLNLSATAFDFGFRSDLAYNDGRSAFRVPGGFVWTREGMSAVTSAPGLAFATAATLALLSSSSAILVAGPGRRSTTNNPGANIVATTTIAGVAGLRHVCDSIQGSVTSTGLLAAAVRVLLVLRDGATGVGAVIRQWDLSLSTTAGITDRANESQLGIFGTAGNAMTLEFTAAGGAATEEIVNLGTYDAS